MTHALPRRTVTAALLAAGLPGCALTAAPADDAALRAAIDGAHRSAANRARDPARHPYEMLRFFGLAPTQQVIELSPGGRLVHRDPGAVPARPGPAVCRA